MKNFMFKRFFSISFLIFACTHIGFLSLYSMDLETAYKTLGLTNNAPLDQVKKQYKKLAIKWHPDKWAQGTKEEKKTAETKFKDISGAYELIEKSFTKELNPLAKQYESFFEDIKSEDVTPKNALNKLLMEIMKTADLKNLVELLENKDEYDTFIRAIAGVGIKYASKNDSKTNDYLDFIDRYIIENNLWWFLDVIDEETTKFKSDRLTELQNRIAQDIFSKIIKNVTSDEQKIKFYETLKKHNIYNSLPFDWKIIFEKKLKEVEKVEKQKNVVKNVVIDTFAQALASIAK